jgi:hypothetical protein
MTNSLTKQCTLCEKTLPPDQFTKDKYTVDGLNRHCRECKAKRHRKRKEEQPEALARYSVAAKAKRREAYRNDPEFRALLLERSKACNRAMDPAKKSMRRLVYRLRGVYSMSLEQYKALYDAAGGKCQVCAVEIAPEHSAGAIQDGVKRNVDHDHDTGRIRGLLCPRCNRGLGYLGDDLTNYVRAARYLERHQKACSNAE